MKTNTFVIIVISALLYCGAAHAFVSRKGLELEGRFGPNVCVERDGQGCGQEKCPFKVESIFERGIGHWRLLPDPQAQ